MSVTDQVIHNEPQHHLHRCDEREDIRVEHCTGSVAPPMNLLRSAEVTDLGASTTR